MTVVISAARARSERRRAAHGRDRDPQDGHGAAPARTDSGWKAELTWQARPLDEVGRALRRLFLRGAFPPSIARAITEASHELSRRYGTADVDVAVRSNATAEDLPEARFAGQQETFLNVSGVEQLLDACLPTASGRPVWGSSSATSSRRTRWPSSASTSSRTATRGAR